MPILVVGADHVILRADSTVSYASQHPIPEGISLVRRLQTSTTQTVIIAHDLDTGPAEYFCKMHSLSKVTVKGIMAADKDLPRHIAQYEVLRRIRAGGPVDFVLTGYKQVFDYCMDSFQPVLLYGRPESLGALPDIESWEVLHKRVINRREAEIEEEERHDDGF